MRRRRDPNFYEAHADLGHACNCDFVVVPWGVFAGRKSWENLLLTVRQIRRLFPGPLGFDAEGTRSGISLLAGTSPGGWTIEGRDSGPLRQRKTASQSGDFKWPHHFRFSQGGGRPTRRHGL